jgi:hypothetical protein
MRWLRFIMNVYQSIYVYISMDRFWQIKGKRSLFLGKFIYKLAYYLRELLTVIKISELPNIRLTILKHDTVIYLFRNQNNFLLQAHVYTY